MISSLAPFSKLTKEELPCVEMVRLFLDVLDGVSDPKDLVGKDVDIGLDGGGKKDSSDIGIRRIFPDDFVGIVCEV